MYYSVLGGFLCQEKAPHSELELSFRNVFVELPLLLFLTVFNILLGLLAFIPIVCAGFSLWTLGLSLFWYQPVRHVPGYDHETSVRSNADCAEVPNCTHRRPTSSYVCWSVLNWIPPSSCTFRWHTNVHDDSLTEIALNLGVVLHQRHSEHACNSGAEFATHS